MQGPGEPIVSQEMGKAPQNMGRFLFGDVLDANWLLWGHAASFRLCPLSRYRAAVDQESRQGLPLDAAPGLVRLICETEHESQELRILLADEQSVIHKTLKRRHCATMFGRGGPNDRNGRKLFA